MWRLIENKDQWREYCKALLDPSLLRDRYATFGFSDTPKKVEFIKFNDPEEYPCLVRSELIPAAEQYEHEFIYYEDAVKLVNSKEEQIDGETEK